MRFPNNYDTYVSMCQVSECEFVLMRYLTSRIDKDLAKHMNLPKMRSVFRTKK